MPRVTLETLPEEQHRQGRGVADEQRADTHGTRQAGEPDQQRDRLGDRNVGIDVVHRARQLGQQRPWIACRADGDP